jgi:Holliday junction resolvase
MRKVSHKGVRSKGHSGEREFCKLITTGLGLQDELSRNIDQVKFGGADIVGLRPFAIEVKRQEQQTINTWWRQAKSQVTDRNPIPVLAYRKNHQKWQIMMPLKALTKKKKYKLGRDDTVTMSPEVFLAVIRGSNYLKYLKKK